MSRSNGIPSYRLHKGSGQAVVTLTDSNGARRDVYLGEYGSTESKAEYARVLSIWQARGKQFPPIPQEQPDLTVSEMIVRFLQWAKTYYPVNDRKEKGEYEEHIRSLRPLNFLFGVCLAKDIGPKAIKAVRELLIRGYEHPEYGPQSALARNTINQRISRVKHCFKWAVQEELVPGTVYHALLAVPGLQYGRTSAKETERVKPVPIGIVEKTIPHTSPVVADMVRLQHLTAMRPGELVIMRAIDIDMSQPTWIYRPSAHKTKHHGHTREIPLGERCQEIVRRYLSTDGNAYLFSPKTSQKLRYQIIRARRTTKVYPSQHRYRKRGRQRLPGDRYTVTSYCRAVKKAAERAGVAHWHPHQLRHTRATEVRQLYGIDAARALLGHRNSVITETYAQLDQGKASDVMKEIG